MYGGTCAPLFLCQRYLPKTPSGLSALSNAGRGHAFVCFLPRDKSRVDSKSYLTADCAGWACQCRLVLFAWKKRLQPTTENPSRTILAANTQQCGGSSKGLVPQVVALPRSLSPAWVTPYPAFTLPRRTLHAPASKIVRRKTAPLPPGIHGVVCYGMTIAVVQVVDDFHPPPPPTSIGGKRHPPKGLTTTDTQLRTHTGCQARFVQQLGRVWLGYPVTSAPASSNSSKSV